VPIVCLNGLHARAHNLNDLVLTKADHFCQGRSDAFLIVGDQDTHALSLRSFHAKGGE
jgi:hypothetical protein